MSKVELPIANGFYESRSLPFSAQRCVNWYPNYAENDALSPAAIFGAPGTDLLVNTGTSQFNRGSHVMANVAYFVNGTTLYQLQRSFDANNNEIFTPVAKGTIPGTGRVSMADNGTQLCIVIPGVDGYIYNKDTDIFEIISDPDFKAQGNSLRVVYIDGYFVHFVRKVIFHSLLNDGLAYNALDFGTAEADPDDIVSSFVLKNQLFILGKETIEVFANVGKFPFTFQRIAGFFSAVGCFSPFSPVLFNDAMAFLGGGTNERVQVLWGSGGQNFTRLSTTPIEQKLQTLTQEEIDAAFTWSYSEDGAVFLGVTAGQFTFVYDAKASRIARKAIWHERNSFRTEAVVRYRVQSMVSAYERILVGDLFSGRIGCLTLNTFDEYGNEIIRRLSSRPFANKSEPLFVDEIELTFNSGQTTSQTTEPLISMRTSDNNITYNDLRTVSMGKLGDYNKRGLWQRLGRVPRFRTFDWIFSDKSDPTIIKAEVRFDTIAE